MNRLAILIALSISLSAGFAQAAPAAKKKSAHTTQKSEVAAAPAVGPSTHHRMAGCGLGSVLIHDSGQWMQVLAATLNGTSGNQTFGMSSGTLNCTQDGVMEASREKEAFIEANNADLRHDIAVGNGEYLSSLASLYGCKGDAVTSFDNALRAHHELLQTDPAATLERIDGIVSQTPGLKAACGA